MFGIEKKLSLIDSSNNYELFEGFPYNFYDFHLKDLTENEAELAQKMASAINRTLQLNELKSMIKGQNSFQFVEEFNSEIIQSIEVQQLIDIFPTNEQLTELISALKKLCEKYFPNINNKQLFAETVLENSIGFKKLNPLTNDENIEEIMVNGFEKNVFIFHSRYGMCKTNISVPKKQLENLILKIARTSGKKFNEENPLLDASLPDGSRVNATFVDVTPLGHSLTIRKFSKKPLSIINLIEKNTLSSELAAFLWLMVEGMNIEPMNLIVTGGTGSGKTTFLSSLTSFIRHSDRIITIEDTPEINLSQRNNWIQMETKPGVLGSMEIKMDDLLKNSLRMRPDRIIVGEVRGEEAQTMFTAMDTGHKGMLGTMHSNSTKEMLLRFKTPPMNVPESMLALINFAVVMVKVYDKEKGVIRRIKEATEFEQMESKVLLSGVYTWNKSKDKIEKTNVPSRIFEVLAEKSGMTKKELMQEMLIRQRILDWMLEQGITDKIQVEKTIQEYYLNPESLLERISEGI